MRLNFYPKLAWDGIRKNRRFYIPYILTGMGMVMMLYIIHYLAAMPTLEEMSGGGTMAQVLGFGFWVVALFAAFFLFYTNSFLMRRRQKEFGLYNMLGMGKRPLGILLFWENFILSVFAIVGGLVSGFLFSKMAELCLIKVVDGAVDYTLRIDMAALFDTWVVFIPVFTLIFIKNVINIQRLSTVSLIKSENIGEKPPKANCLLGIAGIVLLGAAYNIALSIESPLIALAWFFIAVIMVVIGTYLLFISGSVMLCRLLQKNKRYYYQKNHFVSVSSMAYRMKRNGASLASICILSTMVLVMIMGAGSLYFGKEDILNTRYPHNIAVSIEFLTEGETMQYTEEKETFLSEQINALLENRGVEPKNTERYLCTSAFGMLQDGQLILDPERVNAANMQTMEDVAGIYLLPLSSFNRCMGTQEVLSEHEVMLYCIRRNYDAPTITLSDGTVWTVKKHVEAVMGSGEASSMVTPSVFIVVPDIEKAIACLNSELGEISVDALCRLKLQFAFDTNSSAEEQRMLSKAIREKIREFELSKEVDFYTSSVESKEEERSDFYSSFGGIFFLGLFLSVVFIAATVLIIYYKQMTEGYEDAARFEIMQKVGMTKRDIRKSVNSQMLTVFFLPLAMAGIHLAFAFPFVSKILKLFSFDNSLLNLSVALACFALFGIFYAVVYKITSGSYYAIVSSKKEEG